MLNGSTSWPGPTLAIVAWVLSGVQDVAVAIFAQPGVISTVARGISLEIGGRVQLLAKRLIPDFGLRNPPQNANLLSETLSNRSGNSRTF